MSRLLVAWILQQRTKRGSCFALAGTIAIFSIAATAPAAAKDLQVPPALAQCIQAPTPDCLFSIALDFADQEDPWLKAELLRKIGLKQIEARRAQEALTTLTNAADLYSAQRKSASPTPDLARYLSALASAYDAAGRRDVATATFRDALTAALSTAPASRTDSDAVALGEFAIISAASGRVDLAESWTAALPTLKQMSIDYRARELARAGSSFWVLPVAIAEVGRAYARAGDFRAALKTAARLGDAEFNETLAIRPILIAPAPATPTERDVMGALSALAAIREPRPKLLDPVLRSFLVTLADVVSTSADQGIQEGAAQILANARDLAQSIQYKNDRIDALNQIAIALAHIGDSDAALKIAYAVSRSYPRSPEDLIYNDQSHYSETLQAIATAQLFRKDVAGAQTTIALIDRPLPRAMALDALAEAQWSKGDFVDASSAVAGMMASVPNLVREEDKAEILRRVAFRQSKLGAKGAARDAFGQALQAADRIDHGDVIIMGDTLTGSNGPATIGGARRLIAQTMAETGDIGGAIGVAQGRDESISAAFRDIALVLIANGDLQSAEQVLAEAAQFREEQIRRWMAMENGPKEGSEDIRRQRADDHVSLIAEAMPVLARMAVAEAGRGRMDVARSILGRALEKLDSLESPEVDNFYHRGSLHYVRAEGLLEIAKAQAEMGARADSDATFAEAVKNARLVDSLDWRVRSLVRIAQIQATVTDSASALATLREAQSDAEDLFNPMLAGRTTGSWEGPDSNGATGLLRKIAAAESSLGATSRAYETALSIVEPSVAWRFDGTDRQTYLKRQQLLRDIALDMLDTGKTDDALAQAESISVPSYKGIVVANAASIRARAIDYGSAEALLHKAESILQDDDPALAADRPDEAASEHVRLLCRIAVAASLAGDATHAADILTQAVVLADTIFESEYRTFALMAVGNAQAERGERDKGFQTLESARSRVEQVGLITSKLYQYRDIALAQDRLGDHDGARRTLAGIFEFYPRGIDSTGRAERIDIEFATTVAVLMSQLGVAKLDLSRLPVQ
jgi:hypothetical protein